MTQPDTLAVESATKRKIKELTQSGHHLRRNGGMETIQAVFQALSSDLASDLTQAEFPIVVNDAFAGIFDMGLSLSLAPAEEVRKVLVETLWLTKSYEQVVYFFDQLKQIDQDLALSTALQGSQILLRADKKEHTEWWQVWQKICWMREAGGINPLPKESPNVLRAVARYVRWEPPISTANNPDDK